MGFEPGNFSGDATDGLKAMHAFSTNSTFDDSNNPMAYFQGSAVVRSSFLQDHMWLSYVALILCLLGAMVNIFLVRVFNYVCIYIYIYQ